MKGVSGSNPIGSIVYNLNILKMLFKNQSGINYFFKNKLSLTFKKNIKTSIKYLDKKFFNKRLIKFIGSCIYKSSLLFTPKITALRKDTKKKFSLIERYRFFESAQYFLQVNRFDGLYMEFGCHEVNTFRMALNTLGSHHKPNKISKFIAFDSFEGMPEPKGIDRQKIWRKGMNFTSVEEFKRITKKDLYRVEVVKGFYSDTLKTYKFSKKNKIALAYIDCDYYSSTIEVLNFLSDKISHGTLIAFDDWNCYYGDPRRGQRKAFSEFKQILEKKFYFEKFRTIHTGGMSFICLDKEIGDDFL